MENELLELSDIVMVESPVTDTDVEILGDTDGLFDTEGELVSEYVIVFFTLLELVWVRDDKALNDIVVETVLVTPVGNAVLLTVLVKIELLVPETVLLNVLLGDNE